MSWFFGSGSKPQVPGGMPPMDPSGGVPVGNNLPLQQQQQQQPQQFNTESQYRFDSAALERAAQAAKDLEKSKNAKELLELSRVQEKTKQMEIEKQMVEMKTYQEELKANASQKLAEEKRKLLNEETQHNNERARYQDKLARQRHEDQLAQQARMQEELLRKQEESVAKQEKMRKSKNIYKKFLNFRFTYMWLLFFKEPWKRKRS